MRSAPPNFGQLGSLLPQQRRVFVLNLDLLECRYYTRDKPRQVAYPTCALFYRRSAFFVCASKGVRTLKHAQRRIEKVRFFRSAKRVRYWFCHTSQRRHVPAVQTYPSFVFL